MTDMMADVIKRGTGVRARSLGRSDIAGKTGTTNEAKDTWFNGFTPNLVATVWVGYDQERPLGEREEGVAHRAADLDPVHAGSAEGRAGQAPAHAGGARSATGLVANRRAGRDRRTRTAIMETFMADHLPAGNAEDGSVVQGTEGGAQSSEPIF